MNDFLSLYECEKKAQQVLSKPLYDAIFAGAFDEITLAKNRLAFDDIEIKPRCLQDVSHISLETELCHQTYQAPLGISPTSFHAQVIESGEIATANATKENHLIMINSMMSSKSLEEIISISQHKQLWQQVYLFKQRHLTESIINRAEKAGYKAIVLSTGVPVITKRERDIKNARLKVYPAVSGNFKNLDKTVFELIQEELDDSANWDDIHWLQSITKLPIILKGVLNPIDAKKALDYKVSGLIVSNHGGRQLDTVIPSINALPDIANVIDGQIPLMLDSGIRRGSDIFKAIALGADYVFLGRPVLWSLAIGGQSALSIMIKGLLDEFTTIMKLAGCSSVKELRMRGKQFIDCKKL